MTRKKKIIICGITALFIGVAVFLHQTLICWGAESYLSHHLPKGGAITFSYETSRFEEGQFVLHGVVLEQEERKGSPAFHIKIDALKLAFDFHLFPFRLKPQLSFEHPQVEWTEGKVEKRRKKQTLYQILDRQLFRTSIQVHQGEFRLGDQVAFFSFENPVEGKEGVLKVKKGEEDDHTFCATFAKENKGLQFDLKFHRLDLAWIYEIGGYFFPQLRSDLCVERGCLNGTLSFGLSHLSTIDYVKYGLDLDDFTLFHKKYGVEFGVHHVSWKEHFTCNQDLGQLKSHPFFEQIWPYFIGDGEVSGASLKFKDPHSDRFWAAAEVRGSLHFSRQNEPLIQLNGVFQQGEEECPFQLNGEGFIEEETLWKIAMDFNLLNAAETQTYFSLTSKGSEQYLLETEFMHLNTDLLNLMQYIVGVHIPEVHHLQVDTGIFQGKIQGWIENKRFKRFEVTQFVSQNLVAGFPDRKWKWGARTVRGKGEFDFSTPDFFDGTFWELDVSNGYLGVGEKVQVEDLDFHVGMHDQYIKPSKLKGKFGGVTGKAAFEGLYTHLHLDVNTTVCLEELAHLIGQKKSEELKAVVDLDLDLRLKTFQERMTLTGALGISHGEKQRDDIQFGWSWDLLKLWKGELKEALDLGWFKSLNLSDHTLNLPLLFLGRDWRIQGEVNTEGTFNSCAVEFTVDPTALHYQSPSIDMKPNTKEGEKAPSCTFNFDFNERIWRGKIPLKEVAIKEHSFGITFDSFSSEVNLENTQILFQNVDAHADGIHFQSEIILDYHLEDRNELTIQTSKIEGNAEDVVGFLHHFKDFATLELPLEGKITSGSGGMYLRAYIGDIEELLEWKIGLHLQEGRYSLSKALLFENLAGDLYYSAEDQLFKIKETQGQLILKAGTGLRSYELNVPLLELDATQGAWNYDLRLEAPTHDICRVVGTAIKREELHFNLDKDRTRFFGAKVDVSNLTFSEDGILSTLGLKTKLSSLDLFHHLDFLSAAGVLPLKPMILNEMRVPKFEGETALNFTFDRKQEAFSFQAHSDRLVCGPVNLDHLVIHANRFGDHFVLDQFEAGALAMRASMDKCGEKWVIPQFEVAWKQCRLKGDGGHFDQESQLLKLPLDGLKVNLEELTSLFSSPDMDWNYLSGTLFAKGDLILDLSRGIKDWALESSIKVIGEDFGKGKLRLESPETLHFSYNGHQGFQLKEANLNFLHPRSNQLWAKCHFDTLSYIEKEWKGNNVTLTVPPEMIHFLGQTCAFPSLRYEEEQLMFCGYPLRWDNQIEATMDFVFGETPYINGSLKEGYYWVGDKAWYFNAFAFAYKDGAFQLNLNTLFDEIPFDLEAQFSLLPHFTSKIEIQETPSEGRSHDPLRIQTGWNKQEGFYIHNIEGKLCGLDFDFHHHPKDSFLDQSVLTGQLKINVPVFTKLLPEKFQNAVKEFEIGKGYELSGDLVLSKLNLKESYFSGYLKGKNFELLGSVMETLMGEIKIRPSHVELTHFNVSDASGIFSMESVRIEQGEDQRWSLMIPELVMQDFRPSLLNKVGKYPGRIKPLTVRDLHFRSVRGYLGDAKSFTGKGFLNFINTFKRESNLLDLPFEILGRLGLDMGLLAPVRGKLNFIMVDGRVYLTELNKSYSEGKRSQFFLSPNQSSFIDFEGNIDINIKMKQYVLLKITEPFTLSISGTFDNPKYSLK